MLTCKGQCEQETYHRMQSWTLQGRSAPRVPTARLGGQALVPDMLYPLLSAFNPNNARIPTASGARCRQRQTPEAQTLQTH